MKNKIKSVKGFSLTPVQHLYIEALANNECGGNKSLALRKIIKYHQTQYAKEVLSNPPAPTKNAYPCPNCKRPMETWTEANGPDDYKWVGYCEHCKEQFDE